MFYVYILKCSDDSYYVGQTDNIEKRFSEHVSGKGCVYTNKRLPVKLVFTNCFAERKNALILENKIKKWSRKKKEALIDDKWNDLIQLSKRHNKYIKK